MCKGDEFSQRVVKPEETIKWKGIDLMEEDTQKREEQGLIKLN